MNNYDWGCGMKTEHLLYFTKVVELSSLTLASEHLYISQQAISAAIKNLEKFAGVKLFIRTHNGLVATKEGLQIYEKAKKILALISEIETDFSPTNLSNIHETLNIAVTSSSKKNMFSKITTYFYKTYPNIDLNYIHMDNADIMDAIISEQADIGIYSYLKIENQNFNNFTDEISFIAYNTCSFDFLTSLDSPFANYASISMKTLTNCRLIFSPDLIVPKACLYPLIEYYHLQDQILLADSDELFLQMVVDNLASSLVPRAHMISLPETINIPLSDNIKLVSGYMVKANAKPKVSVNAFIDKFVELQIKTTI